MRDPYTIPQTLDEPLRIMLLTVDELLVFAVPLLLLGFVCNALLLGFLVGAGGVALLKKGKGEQGQRYGLHLLYWHYPSLCVLRGAPSSFPRSYRG